MRPVRFGLIGCGVIGKGHLKMMLALPQQIELVAVADLLESRRAEAAAVIQQQAGEEAAARTSTYVDDDELLADERIDAVAVALPTGVRDAVVQKALKLGRHVLFEKPPALHATTIERFMALQDGRIASCGSCRVTYAPSVQAVGRFIAEGGLGPIRVVRIRATKAAGGPPRNPPPPWRQSFALNGGGILVNWGIYDFNYMMELTNWQLKPVAAMAQCWPIAPVYDDRVAACSDADSHFTAMIRCEGGEAIVFERGEFMPVRTEQQWQIVGTEGTLTMTMMGGKDSVVQLDRADRQQGVVSEALWRGNDSFNGMIAHYEDFAAAIHDGHAPRGNLEQCLVMQKVFDAIYTSARGRHSVSIT